MALVGVVGSRSEAPFGVAPCVRALVAAGHSEVTGCAPTGVDAAVRVAAPGGAVVADGGPARWQLAARTRALVAQLAASPGVRLVAWPSGACPAVCAPGGASGSWLAGALSSSGSSVSIAAAIAPAIPGMAIASTGRLFSIALACWRMTIRSPEPWAPPVDIVSRRAVAAADLVRRQAQPAAVAALPVRGARDSNRQPAAWQPGRPATMPGASPHLRGAPKRTANRPPPKPTARCHEAIRAAAAERERTMQAREARERGAREATTPAEAVQLAAQLITGAPASDWDSMDGPTLHRLSTARADLAVATRKPAA